MKTNLAITLIICHFMLYLQYFSHIPLGLNHETDKHRSKFREFLFSGVTVFWPAGGFSIHHGDRSPKHSQRAQVLCASCSLLLSAVGRLWSKETTNINLILILSIRESHCYVNRNKIRVINSFYAKLPKITYCYWVKQFSHYSKLWIKMVTKVDLGAFLGHWLKLTMVP